MLEWVKGLSRIGDFWKDDKAAKVMSGEVGLSALDEATMIDRAVSSAPADRTSGMCLGIAGWRGLNRNVAAADGAKVLEDKMKKSSRQGLRACIEYLMQMQNGQHHRCMVNGESTLFAYLALNKANSNLAMPRRLRNVDDAKLN